MAQNKKRANRINLGNQGSATVLQKDAQKKASNADSNYLTKRTIGSDYYATTDEDPLAGVSKSFKKKKAGNKRQRIDPLALLDNDADDADTDIISALENSAKD